MWKLFRLFRKKRKPSKEKLLDFLTYVKGATTPKGTNEEIIENYLNPPHVKLNVQSTSTKLKSKKIGV